MSGLVIVLSWVGAYVLSMVGYSAAIEHTMDGDAE